MNKAPTQQEITARQLPPASAAASAPLSRAEITALALIALCAAVVPLPAALISISTFLFLLAWLAGGRFIERWQAMLRHPQARISMLLIAWMALSIAWSPASLRRSVDSWWHFRELLLFPLMISVVALAPEKWGRRIFVAFLAGFIVSLIASYMRWFGILPLYNQVGEFAGFGGHTGFSLMLAFIAYACLWLWRGEPRWRPLWAVLAVLCIHNLYFINTGRTGQVAFLALIPLIVYRWLGRMGLIAGVLGAAAFAFSLYFASATVHQRVDTAAGQIERYRAGDTTSSDGLRIEFWVNSVTLICRHPLFGGGSGSFAYEYRALAASQGLTGDHLADNPHNEYLLMSAQYGVVGLAMFLWLWLSQWRSACRETETRRYLVQGLILAMAVGDLFNSLILDNMEGHFYVLLSVALSAAWTRGGPRRSGAA